MHRPLRPSDELLDLLQSDGVLEPGDVERMHRRLAEAWTPIGAMLRQRGKLSMSQLVELLQLQGVEPHLKLGELAVRQGYCTDRDVEEARRAQRESSPHVLDLILAETGCDREHLCKALVTYVRRLEARLDPTWIAP